MEESQRARNIVMSYMRDGMPKGIAVRAAAKLISKLEKRSTTLRLKRHGARTLSAQHEPISTESDVNEQRT